MKISRKVWLILGAVILVAALIIVSIVYFQQVREKGQLNESLNTTENLRLYVLPDAIDRLQVQKNQAESSLNTSQPKFPESVESIEYGEYLFEIADECNVNLASLTFPNPKTVGIYSVVSLSLPVSGTLADIFKFIDTIRTDERFASTDVKSVNVDIGGSKATVNMDIYGHKR
jgi:hypothetical protein